MVTSLARLARAVLDAYQLLSPLTVRDVNGQFVGVWHIFRGAGVARVADGIGAVGVIMIGM